MPSALTELLRSRPSPPESDSDQARRVQTARDDLQSALFDYRRVVSELERQTSKMQAAQSEYDVATRSRSFIPKDEASLRLSTLDHETNVRDQIAGELAKAEESLQDTATHFHGIYYNETKRETERWSAIIDERVRVAGEFHIDGKPLQSRDSSRSDFLPPQVMAQNLRFAWPLRQLAALAPTPIQAAIWDAPRDTQFYANLAGELLEKWDRLQKIKAKI